MLLSRSFRNSLSATLLGVSLASFGVHLWKFLSYVSTRPLRPDQGLGLIYPINNHGSVHYISQSESIGLRVLFISALMSFVVTLLIVPKELIFPSPTVPNWQRRLSFRFTTDLKKPSLALKVIFITSFLFALALIQVIL